MQDTFKPASSWWRQVTMQRTPPMPFDDSQSHALVLSAYSTMWSWGVNRFQLRKAISVMALAISSLNLKGP